jgi:hypothetical protein
MTGRQATGGCGGAGRPPSDDELITRLRRLAGQADPVPESLLSAARAAFALRDVDARVAELVRDSAVDAAQLAVRAAAGTDPRMLSFETGGTTIECEVMARSDQRDIRGQLSGGEATSVEAQVAGAATVSADVGAHGWFTIRGLPAGPLRLRCQLADGATLVTSWTPV